MNDMNEDTMATSSCNDMTARDRTNLNRANGWMVLWLVFFAAATWLIKTGVVTVGPLGWLVAILPTAVGVVAILGFGRFLREADELQRKIQLQALALGFGAGLFAGFGYRLFEGLGAPEARISDASIVIVFFYLIGLWMGRRRYA